MKRYMLFLFGIVFLKAWGLDWETIPPLQSVETIRLSNGLVVYFQQDNSIPLVFVSVVYKVGFRNENTNQKGYTHLLEHMMFKESARYPDGLIHRIYGREAVKYNAHTDFDKTVYYVIAPPSTLETIFKIESDRMQNLLLDRHEFELERQVVADELNGYESIPEYRLNMGMMSKAFPGHPFSWRGGKASEILQASYEEVVDLYRTYYAPNNAFIVVVGQVDKKTLLALLQQYFAPLVPNKKLPVERPQPPHFQAGGLVSLTGPGKGHFGEIIFSLPGFSLTNRDSLLAYFIVEGGIIREMFHEAMMDGSLLSLYYKGNPSFPGTQVEKSYLDREVERARKMLYYRMLIRHQDIGERGMFLTEFLRYGDLQSLKKWFQTLDSITSDEVAQFLKTYLVSSNAVSGYFTATYFADEKRSFSFSSPMEEDFHEKSGRTLLENEKKDLMLYHEKMYKETEATLKQMFHGVERYVLSNGIVILIKPIKGKKIVSLSWDFRETEFQIKKPHQMRFLMDYLTGGGPQYRLQKELAERGGRFSSFTLTVSSEDSEEAVHYLARMLINRQFSPLILEEAKEGYLREYWRRKKNPDPEEQVRRLINTSLMKEGLSLENFATPQTILSLQTKDIESLYYSMVRPENLVIAVVGDVDVSKILLRVKALFEGWKVDTPPLPLEREVLKKTTKAQRLEIRIPGEQGMGLIVGRWKVPYTNGQLWARGILLNRILGDPESSSRLMEEMRETQGLTYSMSTDLWMISPKKGGVLYACYFTTFKPMLLTMLEIYYRKFNELRLNGPDEEELLEKKMRMYAEEIFDLSHPESFASLLVYNEKMRYQYDYNLIFLRHIYESTTKDIQDLAGWAFPDGEELIILGI
ncbi:M16 family metallopeptidase [Thermospira aquatica]|uniref:Insulinase family protein n=1 Tax=Thermospira aquatica TaxID=2828656 RepID=A0AAX3BDK9_9SPIR|nr:pitrilysin family protein [Thermospira aquatica]URA10305.1 insulinase family protein [Thermospira aquatica]